MQTVDEEYEFLEVLKNCIENGDLTDNRTGVKTYNLYGETLKYNLQNHFPILTTRFIPFRIVFEETMFFLRGQIDTKILEEKNVNIWKGNTSREFLDRRGLKHLPEGNMGKGYGFCWRNWNGYFDYDDKQVYYNEPIFGVDQLEDLVCGLKNDPFGRRHIITAWNPETNDEAALPPCHLMHLYSVDSENTLHSSFIMRSNDFFLANNMNVCSYALIQHLLAKLLGYKVGTLTYFCQNLHCYENHLGAIEKQLKNKPLPKPQLIIKKDLQTLDDLLSLQYEDVELIGYQHHGKITAPMAV